MDNYYTVDEWKIIESGFEPERQRASESIFSLGNGHMGQRANFEEYYSGDSLQGSYIAGIYYPDKTQVGWWKNGYPEYYPKVINSVNWIGIDIHINGERLDLATCKIGEFKRVLNMKKGYLQRRFTATLENGNSISVNARRFISMARKEVGAIDYKIKALNFDGQITVKPYLDGDVQNEDANYDEKFWLEVDQEADKNGGFVISKTKKLNFYVGAGMNCKVFKNGQLLNSTPDTLVSPLYVSQQYSISVEQDDEISIQKFAGIASFLNHKSKRLHGYLKELTGEIAKVGFNSLLKEHADEWTKKWAKSDILIEGDKKAQQGIRFNIFQLNQTYTGDNERLNIGPKGFTGEKYGGGTYWDTEGYCLPFYLSTSDSNVARNLLLYRYRHLQKAIENAQKLGFKDGAALYPMVTMNGEEGHNEWEITFEEIHRNGAIAYAIFNYIRHTGNDKYLLEAGLEVLIAISRFWSQRFNFSKHRDKYVMLGVTGPNEYENNVNNNWYTSYLACWCLRYTMECIEKLKESLPEQLDKILDETDYQDSEAEHWQDILDRVYLPNNKKHNVFLQQDGYLDKEQRLAEDLNPDERPLNQHWSWDRILRSCFIKQGDVVQGLYFFEHEFDEETLRCNFNFYEPRTVHESSLSPCIHSILASKLGYTDKAYQLYLRTARLDLDDYNKEVHQGLHITSMAGTWMSIVEGFAGKRIINSQLHFSPTLPEAWNFYSFKIYYRGRILELTVEKEQVAVKCLEGEPMDCFIFGIPIHISKNDEKIISVDAQSKKSIELRL